MNIILSGPLRPSIEHFLENVKNIKSNFPNCRIFLSTWKTYKSGGTLNRLDDPSIDIKDDDIKSIESVVDYLLLLDEPSNNEIDNIVDVKTKQQSSFPVNDEWNILSTYNIYKMFWGIKKMVEFIDDNKILKQDDIVVRYRTDLHLNINIDEIKDKNIYYLISRESSGVSFDDWFSISNYNNFKKVWYFENIDEYKKYILISWNVEDIIKNRVINNDINYKYLEKCSEVYLVRNDKIWGREKYF